MSRKITTKEFDSMITSAGEVRYSYFVKQVADWEEMWSLKNGDGWILAEDLFGFQVIPLWPHPDYAKACAHDLWNDCLPAHIDMNFFLNRWVSGMIKDNRKVAIFPTANDKGVIVDPERIKIDLLDECKKYE